MNQKEKLTEATMLALQGKLLTEDKNTDSIISDINAIIDEFDNSNNDLRYKDYDVYINGNKLVIQYQSQENIDKDDINYICDQIIPQVKEALKASSNSITQINTIFTDRSGKYEGRPLHKEFIISPTSKPAKASKITPKIMEKIAYYCGSYLNEIKDCLDDSNDIEEFIENVEQGYSWELQDLKDELDNSGYTTRTQRKSIYNKLWTINESGKWSELLNYSSNSKINDYESWKQEYTALSSRVDKITDTEVKKEFANTINLILQAGEDSYHIAGIIIEAMEDGLSAQQLKNAYKPGYTENQVFTVIRGRMNNINENLIQMVVSRCSRESNEAENSLYSYQVESLISFLKTAQSKYSENTIEHLLNLMLHDIKYPTDKIADYIEHHPLCSYSDLLDNNIVKAEDHK